MKKILIFIISLIIVSAPCFVLAADVSSGIVPSCNKGAVNADNTGLGTPCNFDQLILLINKIITFLLFTIATPLVALIICYAGFLLLTSGDNSEKRSQAKSILKNVIIGYIIALAAWLIIKSIVTGLGFTGETYLKG